MALQPYQRNDDQQHGARNLRRTGQVRARDPCGVDRHRERVDAQKLRCADVVERFQQGQTQAHSQRRTRHRQGHAAERAPAAFAQHASRFHEVRGLRHEHGTRRHVDIGIEHKAKHEDRAAHRAQIRQTPLARAAVAQHPAQRSLHRADRMQQIEIRKRHDVSRHRQRQKQGPVQQLAPRKIMRTDQPCAGGSHDQREHAHTAHQHGGVERRVRQHVLHQMLPVRPIRTQGQPDQRHHGREHAQRNQHRGGLPQSTNGTPAESRAPRQGL